MKHVFETSQWVDNVWGKIIDKTERNSSLIGARFPYASVDGAYNEEAVDWWTNGFWPGLLWLVYESNYNKELLAIAACIEEKMDKPLIEFTDLHHDVGFMWSLTAVAQYKLTHHSRSAQRALTAASHLAGRFNVRGGFIRAWNAPERVGWAIIDCMMNLSLLYWASEHTGDPRFKHIAMAHADMTLQQFIRKDGSVHHIVCFDPATGVRAGALGGQGYGEDSAWARGTSWAIYGFAISYRYTGEPRYREAAQRTASFFLSQLDGEHAPPWDFRAPEESKHIRDTSAAACAASGLLELARLLPEEEAAVYIFEAIKLLKLLDTSYGLWDDRNEQGMIDKATANYPNKHYVETPIIYGDYFFAEAISKLRDWFGYSMMDQTDRQTHCGYW